MFRRLVNVEDEADAIALGIEVAGLHAQILHGFFQCGAVEFSARDTQVAQLLLQPLPGRVGHRTCRSRTGEHRTEVRARRDLFFPQGIHFAELLGTFVVTGGFKILCPMLLGTLHATAGGHVVRVDAQHVLVGHVGTIIVPEINVGARLDEQLLHFLGIGNVHGAERRGVAIGIVGVLFEPEHCLVLRVDVLGQHGIEHFEGFGFPAFGQQVLSPAARGIRICGPHPVPDRPREW